MEQANGTGQWNRPMEPATCMLAFEIISSRDMQTFSIKTTEKCYSSTDSV